MAEKMKIFNFCYAIKENLSNFEVPQIRTGYKKRINLSLAMKMEAKVADFDIREAIKLLSSDDSLASMKMLLKISKICAKCICVYTCMCMLCKFHGF
jgi:hypothetical protein